MGFLDMLKGAKSAAELQVAHDAIDLDKLAAAIAEAETALRSALLDASDADISKAEKRLADARREHDRGVVRRQELERRIADAERAEARAALEAEHKKISGQADRLAKSLRSDYVAAAEGLIAVLSRLEAAEDAVKQFNSQLGDAGELGDGLERIEPVEPRAFWLDAFGGRASILDARLHTFLKPNGWPDPELPAWPPIEGRLR